MIFLFNKSFIIFLIGLFISSCGGSGSGSFSQLPGTWKGIFTYDSTSCGPLTSIAPNVSGKEYQFDISEPAQQINACELVAVDQNGQNYFHNFSVIADCPSDKFSFAADDEVTILNDELPTNKPDGFVVSNISKGTAEFTITFSTGSGCTYLFNGTFVHS